MAKRARSIISEANAAARAALVSGTHASAATHPDHLGDLAWWDSVPGWRGDVATVTAAVQAAGLDAASTLPSSPDWVVAFGRAIVETRPRVANSPKYAGNYELKDAAAGPNGERRVGICRIARNGVVQLTDEGTVVCPRDGTAPYVERADPNGIASDIVACARTYYAVYTSDDIRTAIVQMLDRWAALPCRAQAPHVVYWVPSAAGQVIRALADCVEALGWGRVELFAGYASDARSAKAATNAVNQGLEARLAEFAATAEKYASDHEGTRVSTLEKQIEQAKSLREQGELYRSILGAAVTSIDERIRGVENSLRRTLGMVDAAQAEKQAAKQLGIASDAAAEPAAAWPVEA